MLARTRGAKPSRPVLGSVRVWSECVCCCFAKRGVGTLGALFAQQRPVFDWFAHLSSLPGLNYTQEELDCLAHSCGTRTALVLEMPLTEAWRRRSCTALRP